jgi:hypothetical protein
MDRDENRVPEEQQVYARWLDWGTRLGLLVLVGTFVVYVLGLTAPHVAFDTLMRIWSLPVDQYRAAAAAPAGWGWVALATRSDYMTYFGIVLLALVTVACYLRALPALLARGERTYALIAAVEIVVLAAAAAGVLGGAH